MPPENLVIIGSGCAGWTAAIYAARADLSPLVVTGSKAGGLLTTTSVVENYPGFPEGIDGNELMVKMQAQATRFGAKVRYLSAVDKVDFSKPPFKLTIDGEALEAKCVIVATGASPRRLNVPGESKLDSRGITYCAVCDGALPVFRNKPLVVIGGGDSACEEALFLTRFASQVYLVHRRDKLKASGVMIKRVMANRKIQPIWNSAVEEVLDVTKGAVTGVKLRDTVNGTNRILDCSGIFVAIGHVPNTSLFDGQLDRNKEGYLILREGSKTNIPGVFGAGDCADRVYRQAVTAAGMGCAAAIDAERYLAAQEI
jgi:thioredoxin reductase (NADPH)